MTARTVLLLALALATAAPAVAQAPPRSQAVIFAKGQSSKTINGSIRGYAGVDFLVEAKAGQTLKVAMKTANPSAYFNVLPPGEETALFNGSIGGSTYSGTLPKAGRYTVRVYLMRNAARRNETAAFTLTVGVTG